MDRRNGVVLGRCRLGRRQRHQTGYFINRHPNGDIDRGTFAGRITTAGDAVTMEGSWKYSGGTGAFARISGGGTYKGRITPTEVQTSWEGTHQLG